MCLSKHKSGDKLDYLKNPGYDNLSTELFINLATSNSTAQVALTWSHQLPGTLCAEFFIEMKNPLAKILRPSKSVLVIKVAMAGRVQPSKHNRVQKTLEFQAETRLKSAMIEKSSQKSNNLQYNTLGRWDK